MKPGLVLAAAGLAAGIGASLAATRLLRHLLWGVRETDPLTFGIAAALPLSAAAAASLAPALRILQLDPAETLRAE